jgi:hypothetical protein
MLADNCAAYRLVRTQEELNLSVQGKWYVLSLIGGGYSKWTSITMRENDNGCTHIY